MLVCVDYSLVEIFGLDLVVDIILDENSGNAKTLIVTNFDNLAKVMLNDKLDIIKCKKKNNEIIELIEVLSLLEIYKDTYQIFNEKGDLITYDILRKDYHLGKLFKDQGLSTIENIPKINKYLPFFQAESLEKRLLKKRLCDVCKIYSYIITLPSSYQMPGQGFLNKYLKSQTLEKYNDQSYFKDILHNIESYLKETNPQENILRNLNVITEFYALNRSMVLEKIEKSINFDGYVISEIIWLSIHFIFMGEVSLRNSHYSVSFINSLRSLEYYIDFIFLYLGLFHVENKNGKQIISVKDMEVSGLGTKLFAFRKHTSFCIKDSLLKRLNELIKLRNSSFFGHAILIPDKDNAVKAKETVICFIQEIEKQARYKGASWTISKNKIFNFFDNSISLINHQKIISGLPYLSTDSFN